jgi:hypothetical protein
MNMQYTQQRMVRREPQHRVYMFFMAMPMGWYVQFLEADLKTPLARRLTFRDPAKIREMFERFSAERQLEDRSALDYAINMGRGSIWLNLTEEQYQKLKK